MAHIFQKALSLLVGDSHQPVPTPALAKKTHRRPLKKLTERQLIQLEGEIGAQLFGPVPSDHRRSFFNLDQNTWIWYEEYPGPDGKPAQMTTRYEVHDNGILKVQEGSRYTFIEGAELQNLTLAIQMYYERVAREVYHRDPTSGTKLG